MFRFKLRSRSICFASRSKFSSRVPELSPTITALTKIGVNTFGSMARASPNDEPPATRPYTRLKIILNRPCVWSTSTSRASGTVNPDPSMTDKCFDIMTISTVLTPPTLISFLYHGSRAICFDDDVCVRFPPDFAILFLCCTQYFFKGCHTIDHFFKSIIEHRVHPFFERNLFQFIRVTIPHNPCPNRV